MKKYLLEVQGQDIFRYGAEIHADSMEQALIKAQNLLLSISKLTIEQFKSVLVAEVE